MNIVNVVPVISTSAYTAGDAVGGKIEAQGATKHGLLHSVTVIDKDQQKAPLSLVLYESDFTADADNAAFSVETADQDKILGVVNITADDYEDIDGNISVATVKNLSLPVQNTTDVSTLRAQLKTTGTPTYTTVSSLTLKLGLLDDGGF
jgi:hypothetical protein